MNADDLARRVGLDAHEADAVADRLRRELVAARESFVFETVFSDPAGEELELLRSATEAGDTVVVCFIGLDSARTSEERVAMRVSQGGHDVPSEKVRSRFARTLRNLSAAIRVLPHVLVFDNSDLSRPFRQVTRSEDGTRVEGRTPLPSWLRAGNPRKR